MPEVTNTEESAGLPDAYLLQIIEDMLLELFDGFHPKVVRLRVALVHPLDRFHTVGEHLYPVMWSPTLAGLTLLQAATLFLLRFAVLFHTNHARRSTVCLVSGLSWWG